MKRLTILVMSVFIPTMVLATANSCKSKTAETEQNAVKSDSVAVVASNSEAEIDVKVVVATTDKGITVYKSPSKTALKLTLVAAGMSQIEFSWTKEGKLDEHSEAFTVRNALVMFENDEWYQVSIEGITGYVSKSECKLATIIPATEEMVKQWYQNDCYQQTVDGVTYIIKWGVYDPAWGEGLGICKVEGGKVLSVSVGYSKDEAKNCISFYPNGDEVTLTNPRYNKEKPDNLTVADLKKLLGAIGSWDASAATLLKIEGEHDWFIIDPQDSEPKGYIEENY